MLPDLIPALRSWSKTPRLTLTLLACIAVSIGGTATVLTFVYALLLRPLPFPAAERLVLVEPTNAPANPGSRPYLSYPNFADLRATASSFELLEGSVVTRLVVQTAVGAERLRGETVTPGYFNLLGVQPALGRAFAADEYAGRGDRAIILSGRIWRTRFAADPAVVGRPISTRSGPAVVVGIMPEGWLGVAEDEGTDYWLAEQQHNHPAMFTDRAGVTTLVFGRLKPGITRAQAAGELHGLLAGLAQAHPDANHGLEARLVPFGEKWRAPLRPGLMMMLLGSLFLLLIGCGNVAILLLARLITRERELAVRLAIGAGRRDLLRLMLAESAVLALAGGAAGWMLSLWLNGLFARVAGGALPLQFSVEASLAPLLLCGGVVLCTGGAFGLLPALVATRLNATAVLRTGGRGLAAGALQGRCGRLLVIGQTALAVILLAGAALFLRSYDKLRYPGFGFRTDHLLRYQVSLPRENYATSAALETFYRNLAFDLRALPGVKNIAYAGPTLPPYDANAVDLRLKGADFGTANGALAVNQHFATNDLFGILRVGLREGRMFGAQDRRGGQPVALVSETLARRIAPTGSAVGRTVIFDTVEAVVIGVVADARWNGQRDRSPTGLNLFLALDQFPQASVGVLFECTVNPRSLIEPARRAVVARDAGVALHWIDTMEEALDFQTANERFWTVLAGAYAGTAFLLAGLGLYGVLTHGVASRVRELGIRMALGAPAGQVARMVISQGLQLVGAGLAVGLGITLLAGRWLEAKLYGTSAQDPVALGATGLLLLVAAVFICWLPARRAARLDPVIALRSE